MSSRKLALAAVVAISLSTTACDAWYNDVPSPDDLMHHIAWFDHMIYQRTIDAYGRVDVPRYTVPGTVPIHGGEVSWRVGDPGQLQYGFDTIPANKLVNPTLPGATTASATSGTMVAHIPTTLDARGDSLFLNYCSACHGVNGVPYADPRVPTVGLKIGAPSLLTERARKYSDGYLYSMVRYGRGVMPQYGDKIYDPLDRWAVVNHVRKLQAAAPMTATVGGEH